MKSTAIDYPSSPGKLKRGNTASLFARIEEKAALPLEPQDNSPLLTLRNPGGAKDFLYTKEWPPSLADTFIENVTKTPLRYYIVDDSTSMQARDGKKVAMIEGTRKLIPCSRWDELVDSLQFHVTFAQAALAPTEFRLVNAVESVKIGFQESDIDNVDMLRHAFEQLPSGETPLCHHIHAIGQEIAEYEPRLRAANQRACIIIATDGECSDGDVAEALKPLKDLPCWVVIRLCTDDDKIVNYWNSIDEAIDLNIDVLDDLASEAKEIFQFNPWLAYAEPMHRMREFGVSFPEMDLLDESLLPIPIMQQVVALIFGPTVASHFTNPEKDWRGFLADVEQGNGTLPRVWCPGELKTRKWININALDACYKGRSLKKKKSYQKASSPKAGSPRGSPKGSAVTRQASCVIM